MEELFDYKIFHKMFVVLLSFQVWVWWWETGSHRLRYIAFPGDWYQEGPCFESYYWCWPLEFVALKNDTWKFGCLNYMRLGIRNRSRSRFQACKIRFTHEQSRAIIPSDGYANKGSLMMVSCSRKHWFTVTCNRVYLDVPSATTGTLASKGLGYHPNTAVIYFNV
jgi:hypothetical protein